MQRFIITIIAIAAIFSVQAQYVLNEYKGSVKVVSKEGVAKRVSRGMQLEGTDWLTLDRGAEAKILNKMRKETYTTKSEGKLTVLKRMVEARRKAESKANVLIEHTSVGIKQGNNEKTYTHHGGANRGAEIDTSDKSPSDIQLIAAMLRVWESYKVSDELFPVTFNYVAGKDSNRLSIINQGSACYYFNVFRIDKDNNISVETYATGDPYLNNRVENCAEWTMECDSALPEGTRRVVVMSDTPYDLEEVLLELQEDDYSYDDSEAKARNKMLKVL